MNRILIVDDEKLVRLITRDGLEQAGYQAEEAPSAEAALEKIEQQPPDLIVLDVKMPGRGGHQFCRDLKCRKETSGIPIIMFTASEGERSECETAGLEADEYVMKSADLTGLIETVKKLLAKKTEKVGRLE